MLLQLKTIRLQIFFKNTTSFLGKYANMGESPIFNILDSVDSTNNYAMAKVHEGLATHGMAWFTHLQLAGKGQRGKTWKSEAGQNILMSIVIKPTLIFRVKPFYLSAFTALVCQQFLQELTGQPIAIKWPNDLYWNDRKAGGILIENIFSGSEWSWAVIGIGININQGSFGHGAHKAVSVAEITNATHSPLELARKLFESLRQQFDLATEANIKDLIERYNAVLYKKGEKVKLRKNFASFNTRIVKVNETGQLITQDTIERQFNFGGVEWILD